jgi:hypothetical protein
LIIGNWRRLRSGGPHPEQRKEVTDAIVAANNSASGKDSIQTRLTPSVLTGDEFGKFVDEEHAFARHAGQGRAALRWPTAPVVPTNLAVGIGLIAISAVRWVHHQAALKWVLSWGVRLPLCRGGFLGGPVAELSGAQGGLNWVTTTRDGARWKSRCGLGDCGPVGWR